MLASGLLNMTPYGQKGFRAPFAFCAASSHNLLGSLTLGELDLKLRSAEAGYWAALWARNKGATTRAATTSVPVGF